MISPKDSPQPPIAETHCNVLSPTAGPWVEHEHRLHELPIAFMVCGPTHTGKSTAIQTIFSDHPVVQILPTEVHHADLMTLEDEAAFYILEYHLEHGFRHCLNLLRANIVFSHIRNIAGIGYERAQVLGVLLPPSFGKIQPHIDELQIGRITTIEKQRETVDTYRVKRKLVDGNVFDLIDRFLKQFDISLLDITIEDQAFLLPLLKHVFYEIDFDQMIVEKEAEIKTVRKSYWWSMVSTLQRLSVADRFSTFATMEQSSYQPGVAVIDEDWLSDILYRRTCQALGMIRFDPTHESLDLDEFIRSQSPLMDRRDQVLQAALIFYAPPEIILARVTQQGLVRNPQFIREFCKQLLTLQEQLQAATNLPFPVYTIDASGTSKDTIAQVRSATDQVLLRAGRPILAELQHQFLVDFGAF